MTTFTVWKFDDPDGAERMVDVVKKAASQDFISILDHAIVSWPEGAENPSTKRTHDSTRRGVGWGALWGGLFGTIFLVPVLGAAAGAAIGGIGRSSQDIGVDEKQIETIREQITPGTSALFLVTESGNLDAIGERTNGLHATLVATNLTEAERATLLEVVGG